ncbi:MAG: RNA-splicing ligase RtcB [Elusimicrobia bacterium CG06_land_8_20_14_3_00_38_11]|nr:MAG: RNA-splicing ligase RtcB [Elusimicrobia bacterium CG06_land_8_20_14_3_00_38_11]
MSQSCPLKKVDDYRWKIEKTGGMHTEGLIFASEKMVSNICSDNAYQQVSNVATLPGIVGYSLAMPDIHWGYGFPIGGVAAFNLNGGVISPGGIGYDINCGVRLLRTNLSKKDIGKNIKNLIAGLFTNIPSGVGSTGKLNLSSQEVKNVLEKGASWAIDAGFGEKVDSENIEEKGILEGANFANVSPRAIERGREQLGTLGAGNHFLEIQEVVEIYDEKYAQKFGIFLGQITVMIHTGSRGLGYQVCDDYIKVMLSASRKYGINLIDKQLACAPVLSDEGKKYFSAMACAANYAFANRQIITHWVRETFMKVLTKSPKDLGLELVYDVAHNIGKFEEHGGQKIFIHRKGATRSFPNIPVLIPGTMGTASYVLVGTEQALKETYGSTCHGAGRVMSRTQALKGERGSELAKRLESEGITVHAKEWKTLAEEAPSAYKDVNLVVDVCHRAGISQKVAKMRPLGVIKG